MRKRKEKFLIAVLYNIPWYSAIILRIGNSHLKVIKKFGPSPSWFAFSWQN